METFIPFLPVGIFFTAIILIALEVFEKSLIVLLAGTLMVILGFLTPEEAVEAVDFETIILLMSMMLLVAIARKSGVFSWMNVRLVALTRGNPLFIFITFSLLTAILSAFLDNVTTILVVLPITIELFKGLGQDPKPLIFTEIFMSNIGGTMTLIGDPPNIIIGGARGLSFNDFIVNLWIPVSIGLVIAMGIMILCHWQSLKPIAGDLPKLMISTALIRRLQYLFIRLNLQKAFVVKSVLILLLTIAGFTLQPVLHIHPHVIALFGASLLALLCSKEAHIHELLHEVEWTTLLFFSGLFVLVAAVEQTGILKQMSMVIVNTTTSLPFILLLIIWISGLVSMVFDNIPFVTVMIPVVSGIEAQLAGDPHVMLLWWALSLGVCLGGNGTIIGASANVIGTDLARREGFSISFMEYLKVSLPITCTVLLIASAYILTRVYFF